MGQGKSDHVFWVNIGDDFNMSQHEELVAVAHTAPRRPRAMSFSVDCGRGRVDYNSIWLVSAGHSGELV